LVSFTAARALGLRDEIGWAALLGVLDDNVTLESNLAAAALKSEVEGIVASTAWYLAERMAAKKTFDSASIGAALDDAIANHAAPEDPELLAGLELLARALGRPAKRDEAFWKDFRDRSILGACIEPLTTYLTPGERAIFCERRRRPVDGSMFRATSVDVLPPPYPLLLDLPSGVASSVLQQTGCKDDWIGNVAATATRSGQITAFAIDGVDTTPPCKRALQTLIPLTIVENNAIDSALSTLGTIIVRSRKGKLCLDEEPPRTDEPRLAPQRVGVVKAPVVKRRIEPEFSSAAREALRGRPGSMVVVESLVTTSGCVIPLRALVASQVSDLNRSALLALSQWEFEPGTLAGQPVSTIFNLTINFKLRM
jgi:TonB family protein